MLKLLFAATSLVAALKEVLNAPASHTSIRSMGVPFYE